MDELSLIRLPTEITDEALAQQATRMRPLRLLSLQTDPASFITRYEDEVDKPLQFAIKRIGDPAAEHFVATTKTPIDQKSDVSSAEPYVAFLVLLKTEPSKASDVKEYLMAALYVHPEHRGKGVMSRLIKMATQWASEESRQADAKEVIIRTTVAECNVSAQRLYVKLGFEEESRSVYTNTINVDVPAINMKLHLML